MPSYNLTKAADRARFRADRVAEIAAVDAGTWPRDLDDACRWHAPPRHDATRHARAMCAADVAYLDGVEERIAKGELPGWEPQP